MNTQKKIALTVLIIVIVAILAYATRYLYCNWDLAILRKRSYGYSDYNNVTVYSFGGLRRQTIANFPLQKSSSGVQVEILQRYLNNSFNTNLCEDGIWSNLTDKAFRKIILNDANQMHPRIQILKESYIDTAKNFVIQENTFNDFLTA